ncbi:RNA-binding protein [archaeon CG07_land_8_20_14_0_80_38_8]|nr:MAG: RNA-binding protein [archaeon CG07_land_8_20_14_0_80_38_8]PIU88893.1 MAG: RNA-binding protein [archaeon CG06_land_8_20_14_3_00_37_11]
MMEIKVKDKSIVTPGELIAANVKFSDADEEYRIKMNNGIYKKGSNVYASVVGIFKENGLKVIQLSGSYIPRQGDYIIGKVIDMSFSNWFVDIRGPYEAGLRISEASTKYLDTDKYDMSHYFDFGEYIFAKITDITDSKKISLSCKESGLGKLEGGIITRIDPSKFPRLLGTNDSMIDMIEKLSNTKIEAGHNGLVWIKGPAEGVKKAKEAVKLINKESHLTGLTEKVEKLLQGGKK